MTTEQRKPEPRVLSWDWKEDAPIWDFAELVREISGGTVHITEVDTGSDQCAYIVSAAPLTADEARRLYEKRWERTAGHAPGGIVSSTSMSAVVMPMTWPNSAKITPLSPCLGALYEPGVTHEHKCLASSPHGALDHTCECGKTWPGSVSNVTGRARPPAARNPARCSAHGRTLAEHERDDPPDCNAPPILAMGTGCAECETYAESGLHWDTCPQRGRFRNIGGRA